jgi:hypothetical protein
MILAMTSGGEQLVRKRNVGRRPALFEQLLHRGGTERTGLMDEESAR